MPKDLDSTSDKRNDELYRDKLTKLQYEVTRNSATERPFTGEYWDATDKGVYLCVCCGEELFSSEISASSDSFLVELSPSTFSNP